MSDAIPTIESLVEELHKQAEHYGYMLAQHQLQGRWTIAELELQLGRVRKLRERVLAASQNQAASRFQAGIDIAQGR